ncbi:IS3 family transposase [Microbacterium sp. AGC85]
MIEAEKADPDSTMTIARMRALAGVDRRRFYEWRARVAAGPSPRQQRAVDLTTRIRAFHAASDGTYGAPRIHADLQDSGVVVSRKTVAKLMQADGITGISPRTWHPGRPRRVEWSFFGAMIGGEADMSDPKDSCKRAVERAPAI